MRTAEDDFLYTYYQIDETIREKRKLIHEAKKTIKDIEGAVGISSVNMDGMPHASNANSNGILNAILSKDRQVEKLETKILEMQKDIVIYLQLKTTIGKIYEELDTIEKALFRGRYKWHRDNATIAEQTGYSLRTIDRKIRKIRTLTREAVERELINNENEEES